MTTLTAKKMYPDKSTWEKIGFEFNEIENNRTLYQTTLPKGWRMQHSEIYPWIDIIDEHQNIRGKMFYKKSYGEEKAHMSLHCKYQIHADYITNDYNNRIVYFGSDNEIIYIAGIIKKIHNPTKEQIQEETKEEERLIAIATNWANINYPHWQQVDAYWNPTDQKQKRRTTKMAKSMYPDQCVWESLGFEFKGISPDDITYETTLPTGWRLQHGKYSSWINIIDEFDNIRGKMFYKTSNCEKKAHMNLYRKYKISAAYLNGDYFTRTIFFGNDEEVLFVAGQITGMLSTNEETIKKAHEEEERLIAIAINWANENYPNWQNVDAYWNPKTNHDIKTKKRNKPQ